MPKFPAGWNCKRCPAQHQGVQEASMKVAVSLGKEYKEELKERA